MVTTIVNQIKGLGYKLSKDGVVTKVLKSLSPKWDYAVVAIKESKDITKMSMDDPSGSLQVHEVRINRIIEKPTEKAICVKGEFFGVNDPKKEGFRGHDRAL